MKFLKSYRVGRREILSLRSWSPEDELYLLKADQVLLFFLTCPTLQIMAFGFNSRKKMFPSLLAHRSLKSYRASDWTTFSISSSGAISKSKSSTDFVCFICTCQHGPELSVLFLNLMS